MPISGTPPAHRKQPLPQKLEASSAADSCEDPELGGGRVEEKEFRFLLNQDGCTTEKMAQVPVRCGATYMPGAPRPPMPPCRSLAAALRSLPPAARNKTGAMAAVWRCSACSNGAAQRSAPKLWRPLC